MAEKNIKIRYNVDGLDDLERAAKIMGRTSENTDKVTKSTSKLNKEFGNSSGIVNTLRDNLAKFTKQRDAATDVKSVKQFNKAIAETEQKLKSLTSNKKPFIDLSSTISKLGIAAAGAFTIDKIVQIGQEVIKTTAEFQKFEAVLTNTLGSNSAAQVAMAKIVDFASKTPFSVQELTDSFVKLANQGFTPTTNQLRQLGDLAASTGKSFNQLTEALIDAQTGEFERLKEFGIRASKEGDKVRFTFKGVETQVNFTNEAIQKYVLGLGDLQGVSGSMAAISETLGGKISNLGDSYDQLLLALGKLTGGPINFLINEMSDLLKITTQLITSNDELAKQRHLETIGKEAEEISERYKTLIEDNVRLGQTRADAEANAFNQIKEDLQANIKLEKERIEAIKDEAWSEDREERIRALREELKEQNKLLEVDEARLEALKKLQKSKAEEFAKEKGLLEQLRASLKAAQDQREKETDEKQILAINKRIKFYSQEIKRLEDLGKEAEKTRKKLNEFLPIDNLEERAKKLKAIQKALFGETDNLIKDQTEKYIAGVDEQIKARAKQAEFEDKKRKEALEKEKEYRARQQELYRESFAVSVDLLNNLASIQQQKTQNRISILETEKQAQISAAGQSINQRQKLELDYDAKILALKRQQAQRDKRIATFNALINVAQGVTKALAEGGVAGILLGALVAAAGAVQIATINSQQTPQFNKGTKSVPGPHTNRDTVDAKLTPGEMVIPLHTKKKYQPILNQIFDHNISPEVLNNLANGRTGGGIIVSDNRDVVKAIEGLPITEFNWDEDGVSKYVQKKGSRTQYLNKKFSVK